VVTQPKRDRGQRGYAAPAADFAIWLFGYLSAGHAPLFYWKAATPWWISSFVPNLEADLGLADPDFTLGSLIPLRDPFSLRGRDPRVVGVFGVADLACNLGEAWQAVAFSAGGDGAARSPELPAQHVALRQPLSPPLAAWATALTRKLSSRVEAGPRGRRARDSSRTSLGGGAGASSPEADGPLSSQHPLQDQRQEQ